MKRITFLAPGCTSSAPSPWRKARLSINGAGATFPYPMYSKWFDEYHKKLPNLRSTISPSDPAAASSRSPEGTVDFGATDGPMNDEQLKAFQDKHGSAILHFPTVLGADVPTYNIPGVSAELNFTPEALAGIFLGRSRNGTIRRSPGPTRA